MIVVNTDFVLHVTSNSLNITVPCITIGILIRVLNKYKTSYDLTFLLCLLIFSTLDLFEAIPIIIRFWKKSEDYQFWTTLVSNVCQFTIVFELTKIPYYSATESERYHISLPFHKIFKFENNEKKYWHKFYCVVAILVVCLDLFFILYKKYPELIICYYLISVVIIGICIFYQVLEVFQLLSQTQKGPSNRRRVSIAIAVLVITSSIQNGFAIIDIGWNAVYAFRKCDAECKQRLHVLCGTFILTYEVLKMVRAGITLTLVVLINKALKPQSIDGEETKTLYANDQ